MHTGDFFCDLREYTKTHKANGFSMASIHNLQAVWITALFLPSNVIYQPGNCPHIKRDTQIIQTVKQRGHVKSDAIHFFMRTSNFGAEAERSNCFFDLRLKMFLRRS